MQTFKDQSKYNTITVVPTGLPKVINIIPQALKRLASYDITVIILEFSLVKTHNRCNVTARPF